MAVSRTSSKKLWVALWLPVVLSLNFSVLQGQEVNDYDQIDNPAVLPLITPLVYRQISNLTSVLSQDISSHSSFCVKDPEADWNQAFNFSSDLDFLASCIRKTKGDIKQRLCTAAEIKFYLNSYFDRSTSANYLMPNKNCNLTSWVSGCEPGWACSVGQTQQVDVKNSNEVPARTTNCQACCEGFFCPHGITCMIHIFTSCLPCSQIIHVEEQIFGLMLVAAVRYFVQPDHVAQQPPKKSLAVVGCFEYFATHCLQLF